jgi:ATP-binding cassette subfamily B protein
VRLFDLGKHFQTAYQTLRQRMRLELLQITRRQGFAKLLAGVFAALLLGIAMGWMAWQAFLGIVTLGDIALFYQALSKGQNMLRTLLDNAGRIYSNTLFLENLFKFLEIEPKVVDPDQPVPAPERLTQGIRFRGVTFHYPGSAQPVFTNFDLTIPADKVVAIVGSNGAGKTTLVKLLCRLYDPVEGTVEFDGIDIRRLRVGELRRLITGMFQFPVHYFSAVSENIAMGDLADTDKTAEIETAARRAGAHDFITRLPQGYDTLLGKLFPNGAELSGGEWQRLALARSFFRQAPVMILDEPTSFMDSWAEVDWFDRFRELATGRTVILITHRFTIARKADIIHVMEDGRIVETGTHEELLAANGRYAESWLAQTNPTDNAQATHLNGKSNVHPVTRA